MTPPRLLLVDLDAALVEAWHTAFAPQIDEGTVDVRRGSLLDALPEADAVFTAGNSYGQMDGGVDRALANHWPNIQRAVWAAIADTHHGYQPVGTASLIPTNGDPCRWLVYAPTMRVPMRLSGPLEIAVHDAFWSALIATSNHPISTIASPGFGTGFGGVNPTRAAHLMATAYAMWRLPSTTPISQREQLLSNLP
ncbi:MAG: hypothetical protein HOV67_13905 [Kribbellaceae bacterium]|nr:hypothetical protein [Kribbellaceae bacterium]